jgi:hypothetical protein
LKRGEPVLIGASAERGESRWRDALRMACAVDRGVAFTARTFGQPDALCGVWLAIPGTRATWVGRGAARFEQAWKEGLVFKRWFVTDLPILASLFNTSALHADKGVVRFGGAA